MSAFFRFALQTGLNGTLVFPVILILRGILRKAPKQLSCVLWGFLAIRLLVPFSVASNLSILPDHREEFLDEITAGTTLYAETSGSFWDGHLTDPAPSPDVDTQALKKKANTETVSTNSVIEALYFAGATIMLSFMIGSIVSLKRKLMHSVPYAKGIRQSDRIPSPFIFGFFRPAIYVPFGLEEGTMRSVLAHERAHIKRGDHIFKPLAFLLLSFHWYNPIMWLSYVLFCRDIEAACDEKVLINMTESERRDYARALLLCATRSAAVYICPAAFGEQNVKGRIKMTLSYKKPVLWMVVLAVILILSSSLFILTDPKKEAPTEEGEKNKNDSIILLNHETEDNEKWWGNFKELKIVSGTNDFEFMYEPTLFDAYNINKSAQWKDPVMAIDSIDELIEMLETCHKSENLNLITKNAIKTFFRDKEKSFQDLYPASTPPNFFKDHVVLVFYTRTDPTGYVEKITMEKEDGALELQVHVSETFINAMSATTASLQFYWISRAEYEAVQTESIQYKVIRPTDSQWINHFTYVWKDTSNQKSYYITLRENRYKLLPEQDTLQCAVYFGEDYCLNVRSRSESPRVVSNENGILKLASLTSWEHDAQENGVKGIEHTFRREENRLIYDAKASKDPIIGLPDGAVFTLTEYL